MANEIRVRQNGIGGLVEDAPLTAGATLLTSAGLAAIAGGIGATQHMAIVLDPDGTAGAPEIAYITALTAGAGATGASGLLRGQEGTTARQHLQDIPWVHTATTRDYDGLLAWAQLRHATVDTALPTTSTTAVEVDSTNLSCTFMVPPSGRVLTTLQGYSNVNATTYSHIWSLRSSAPADVPLSSQSLSNDTVGSLATARIMSVGLTPGATLTWRWAWRASAAGTINLFHGPTYGALLMEVWAVNV